MITTQSAAVTTFNFAKIEGAGLNKGSTKLVSPITRVHFRSASTLCDDLGVAVTQRCVAITLEATRSELVLLPKRNFMIATVYEAVPCWGKPRPCALADNGNYLVIVRLGVTRSLLDYLGAPARLPNCFVAK